MAKKKTKAKNDNTTTTTPKTPRQASLKAPGMEPRHPELEALFEDYDEQNCKRVAATNATKVKFQTVLDHMREKGIKAHKFSMKDGTTTTLKYKPGKDTFTVHKQKPEAFKDKGE